MRPFWHFFIIALSGVLSSLPISALVVLAEPTPQLETQVTEEATSPETEVEQPETEAETEVEQPELPETEAETEVETRSPEEIERYEKLAQADRLYREGQIAEAEKLYREVKPPFSKESQLEAETRLEPIVEVEQLSPAGRVFWREAEAGRAQKLETRVIVPLELLVEQYPEFIPGHLRLAEVLAEYDRSEEALKVLEQAANRYPHQPDLVKAQIAALEKAEKWLDASMVARQYALLNSDRADAEEFSQLAQKNLERFQSHLRGELRGNAIANAITGALGYALTGNIFGPISAVDTTLLMLRGESAVGESLANRLQKRLPMVEDEEILAYVNQIGQKLIPQAGREFEYEFYIVLDEELNAFALPGGKVFVNAGAILKTNSEAELAGLLAHEISHAVLSHGFQLATSGSLTSNIAQYIPYGGIASNLLVFRYSRGMERQADELGTQILAASGYAADGMRNLMAILEEEEDLPSLLPWLSTHPDVGDRIRSLEQQIVRNGYNRYAYEGVEKHAEIQKRLKPLLEEEKQRQERRRNRF